MFRGFCAQPQGNTRLLGPLAEVTAMLTHCFGCLASATGAASQQLCLMIVTGLIVCLLHIRGCNAKRKSSPTAGVSCHCSSAPSITSNASASLRACFSTLYFQTDEAGCFSTNVSLSPFSRDFRYYRDSIAAEASLVEDASGDSGVSAAWEDAGEDVLI